MMAARLKRLLAMDGQEVRFRASSAVRREASWLAYLAHRPSWHYASLATALRADNEQIAPAVHALDRGDWNGAHEILSRHFATRPRRFVVNPSARTSVAAAIQRALPNAEHEAVRRAERILAGRFDLLGYRDLRFSESSRAEDIDWHFDPVHRRRGPRLFWARVQYLEPAFGDHKIIWELNRHQYWLALGRAYWLSGDARFRGCFVEHLRSWMSANPPLTGMNWASMLELAFRSISWLWALEFFAETQEPGRADTSGTEEAYPWTIDLLLGIDRQLTLVEQNLSQYFSPNTHLLGEALALYVVGRALPELSRAATWERLGRTVLIDQISKQINGDGGHAELSTHYHRYTFDFYLLALSVARLTGDSAVEPFADAVTRLARFTRTMADDNGRLPSIGDEDGGALLPICGRDPFDVADSLQLAASLLDDPGLAVGAPAEEVAWMTGTAPAAPGPQPWPSAGFAESGYFVSRTARNDHLVVDAGPHGFLNGGHAHADALAVTLSVRGRPLFIDPGTGCYTIDPVVRDRFRSTRCHNTLTLDDRPQSEPRGPFHWRTAARGQANDWQTGGNGRFDYFEGSHDGYDPIVHQRAILARPGCWIVADRVNGSGFQRADLYWHFDPAWTVTRERQGLVRAEHADGLRVWICAPADDYEIYHASDDGSGLGWCAPVYGQLLPTSTLKSTRHASMPFTMTTVIVESQAQPEISLIPVTRDAQPDEEAVAVRITLDEGTDTVMLTRWHGSTAPAGMCRAGNITTDARVLCWRETSQSPAEPAVLIDGRLAQQD